jgi:hypothetical protein
MPAPPKEDDKLPEAEAEARFNRLVGKLVNTPHKPHKPLGVKESDDPHNGPDNCGDGADNRDNKRRHR